MKKKFSLFIIILTFSLSGCNWGQSSTSSSSDKDTSTIVSSSERTDVTSSEPGDESSVPNIDSSDVTTTEPPVTDTEPPATTSEPGTTVDPSDPSTSTEPSEPPSSSEPDHPLPTFTVNFVTNAPVTIDPIVTSKLDYPPVITNEPLVLIGWYFEASFTNIARFPLLITEDITLYAKWGEVTDGINYDINSANNGYVVTSYAGNALQVIIPDFINNLPVTEIGAYAFYENGTVNHVTLPSNLEAIGFGAFKNATRLESISFPAALKTISSDAFSGASNLTAVNLENTALITLGDNSFENTKLTSAILPATVTTIGARAFAANALFVTLTVHAATPPYVYHNSFDSTALAAVKVASNRVSTYKNSSYWASYEHLIVAL